MTSIGTAATAAIGIAIAAIPIAATLDFDCFNGSNNLIGVTRLIQKAVNEQLGIGKKQRNKPSASEAETTVENSDAIGDVVRDRIKAALKK